MPPYIIQSPWRTGDRDVWSPTFPELIRGFDTLLLGLAVLVKWIQNVLAFGGGKGRKYSVQTCNGDINSEFLLTLASEWGLLWSHLSVRVCFRVLRRWMLNVPAEGWQGTVYIQFILLWGVSHNKQSLIAAQSLHTYRNTDCHIQQLFSLGCRSIRYSSLTQACK